MSKINDSKRSLNTTSSRNLHEPLTIGVTGTKGKTSTVHFIAQFMESAGYQIALDSTVNCRLGSYSVDPCTNFKDVRNMMLFSRKYHIDCVVIEVGVGGHVILDPLYSICQFDCAIFTSLGADHLNYYRSMRNYISAKKKLFAAVKPYHKPDIPKWIILNRDDPAWQCFLQVASKGIHVATYSAGAPRGNPVSEWDFCAQDIVHRRDGTIFHLNLPNGLQKRCEIPIHGTFNVYNLLAATACVQLYKIPLESTLETMKHIVPPPGRFEIVSESSGTTPWVVIDYAHTAESLEAALLTARGLVPTGEVICVFGCGGNCYKAKRPKMGQVAGRIADAIVLTSDNPRNEDPQKIIREIRKGVARGGCRRVSVETDRERAIKNAIKRARPSDIVLIEGKGHETTQSFGEIVMPFSDREAALRALTT